MFCCSRRKNANSIGKKYSKFYELRPVLRHESICESQHIETTKGSPELKRWTISWPENVFYHSFYHQYESKECSNRNDEQFLIFLFQIIVIFFPEMEEIAHCQTPLFRMESIIWLIEPNNINDNNLWSVPALNYKNHVNSTNKTIQFLSLSFAIIINDIFFSIVKTKDFQRQSLRYLKKKRKKD